MSEMDRLIRQLRIAVERRDLLAATVLRARIAGIERRVDRITVRPDGQLVNESAMDRYLAGIGR